MLVSNRSALAARSLVPVAASTALVEASTVLVAASTVRTRTYSALVSSSEVLVSASLTRATGEATGAKRRSPVRIVTHTKPGGPPILVRLPFGHDTSRDGPAVCVACPARAYQVFKRRREIGLWRSSIKMWNQAFLK